MIKVLQINTVYKNGGSTGRIVYDLKSIGEKNNIMSMSPMVTNIQSY